MNKVQTSLKRIAGVIMMVTACVAVFIPSAPAAPKAALKTLTADSVFIDLPHNVLQILNLSTRMDMIDYFRADSIYKATNLVDGESWLENLTADYLKARLTDVSTLEVKILPAAKGGDIAAVSYTVDSTGEQPDSQLFFFDADMNQIPTERIIKEPQLKHFFKIDKGCKTSMKEIEDMVKFPTILYSFSPDNPTLTATLTVGENMDPDDFNLIKLFITDPLKFTWSGKQYKR